MFPVSVTVFPPSDELIKVIILPGVPSGTVAVIALLFVLKMKIVL
jgi:hypothetical protein